MERVESQMGAKEDEPESTAPAAVEDVPDPDEDDLDDLDGKIRGSLWV